MSTRKTTSILLLVTSLALATIAHAGEFSMAGGDMSANAAASVAITSNATMEPVSRTSSGGDTMGYGPPVTSDVTNDDAPSLRATTDAEASAPIAAPARAVAPATTPAAQTRARSSNRWQSLVPGAIK